MADKVMLLEAAQVLIDEIDGLSPFDRIGQINPIALTNIRIAIDAAIRSARKTRGGKKKS